MDRVTLQQIARLRLDEARSLLEAGHYSGAYYLAGYAVECGLKACIAKRTRRHEFPDLDVVRDSYTHDLAKLARVASLQPEFDALAKMDPVFGRYWALTKDWSEASRYQLYSAQQARELYRAIADRSHGVMRWIRRRW